MISDRCDFNDFVLKTKGRDYQEIIYMTEREATEAERRFYHHSTPDSEKVNGGQGYARSLKGFIAFMRYGVKPAHINQETLMLFDHFRDDVRLNMRPARIKH
jgi:hypothetical protein